VNLFPNRFIKIKIGQFLEIADILLEVHAYKKKSFCYGFKCYERVGHVCCEFINQITAPGGHIIQLTIMIDTQQTCPTLS
jgi:hypothetical protein